ncbi:Bug family tripartite tricarboxylate transporter substrate binding protein [Variovorax arabinosiphilus]|uniref:Bug family tripartite tricarboxylate transporter substrate binding protein n=1 Tax=Variovorax arabinosiphilus TaxID=3053498 RepID=UPI0025761BE5|nr:MULTISPECIES: tripartite tricarboxylate transporter substrate-binding protein [unclassified Variovorax]MDM0120388.1 tripartite tricarboxylate transporter substrate-binding protein [Variovorax sp. J2L1-78]MDM0127700.1 tripartite tricarboxylate transporter substrate-binding protein [Variovorax sp. J2L1-63]MDM0231399.1 tripartite tricarboxylate transporter substrate-binding protein [Variovorax sp. J2R1-6]
MSSSIFLRRTLLAAAVALTLPATVWAAGDATAWPNAKPITWIVGFPPGGTVDVLTRVAARKLGEKTGQSVVVENRPGASGAIALQAAAKAAPDGYTLITVPGPVLYATQPPEVGKELVAVATLAQGPMVLVSGMPNAPAQMSELIQAMKKNPAAWSYATSGNGTSQHLAGELFNVSAGTAMTHVPYKGGGQAVVDVVGAQIPLGMLGVTPVLQQIKSGKLKAYAVTTGYRIESLPDVPTMKEAGLKDYDAAQWYVVAAPKGMQAAQVQQLNTWINEVAASAELRPALVASGSIAGKGSAKDAQQFIESDTRKWKELATKAKLDIN